MPSRRVFLQQASVASSAVLLGRSDWFKAPPLIGLQLYTVRSEIVKDVPGTIQKVAGVGYNSVETFGYSNGKYFNLSVEDFANLLKQNNLVSPSGHYMMMDYMLKGDEDQLKRTVDDAAKMSHEFFTIPYLTDAMRTSIDDYKKLAVKLNKAGEAAKGAGMKLAYHNHDFEFKDWGGGQRGYDILTGETDPGLVNFEMDIYWVTKANQDPIALIDAHPGRIMMWHIKDMEKGPDRSFTEVGDGIIDFKKIFKYKKKSGMKYFFVEQDVVKIPLYDSIAKSYNYIKNNIVA
jgi:sugar phosphate isomerase/epimerase